VADTSTVVATILGNGFNSKYGQYFDLSGSGTFSGDITNNTFQIMDDDNVITLSFGGAQSPSFPDLNIANNVFTGGDSGLYIENSSTSGTLSSISVTNNTFNYLSGYGVEVSNTGSNQLNLDFTGNLFNGFVTNAVNMDQSSGTSCVQLNNNTANLFPNAYSITGTGGTLNLVTPTGNIGQVTTSGTTPVSSCD
jgi:hypothetical protein